MCYLLTKLKIIDNSGALFGRCIKILKPFGRPFAKTGDLVLVSVLKTVPGSNIKKGDLFKAVIVRSSSPSDHTRWEENAAILVKTAAKTVEYTPIGSRVKGPISESLKQKRGCGKLLSLAKFSF